MSDTVTVRGFIATAPTSVSPPHPAGLIPHRGAGKKATPTGTQSMPLERSPTTLPGAYK